MSAQKYQNIKVLMDTYWKIKELAAKDHLSMSEYLRQLVQRDAERRETQEHSEKHD